ncbi:hypothetical protein ACWEN6_13910 [Sphaerisporangium sp. NPDC004334]
MHNAPLPGPVGETRAEPLRDVRFTVEETFTYDIAMRLPIPSGTTTPGLGNAIAQLDHLWLHKLHDGTFEHDDSDWRITSAIFEPTTEREYDLDDPAQAGAAIHHLIGLIGQNVTIHGDHNGLGYVTTVTVIGVEVRRELGRLSLKVYEGPHSTVTFTGTITIVPESP